MNELISKINEIIFEINKEMVQTIIIIRLPLAILYIKVLVYKKKALAWVQGMVDADLGEVIWGSFFKKPEYSCCYSYTYLTCDQDDVKNFNHLKFSGFNLEPINRVGIGINNLLSKNLQLHLYDYNRLILEIVVENMTATGATPLIIIILACVIAIITIPLILYMVPWWKINGHPIMPGPYQGQEKTPFW